MEEMSVVSEFKKRTRRKSEEMKPKESPISIMDLSPSLD
jgi:hypothetical protein